jgi:hypothetical protein
VSGAAGIVGGPVLTRAGGEDRIVEARLSVRRSGSWPCRGAVGSFAAIRSIRRRGVVSRSVCAIMQCQLGSSPEWYTKGDAGSVPRLPLSYGSPAATFPICPDTGSRPAASLSFLSSPPSPKMALEAAVVMLVTASMLAAGRLSLAARCGREVGARSTELGILGIKAVVQHFSVLRAWWFYRRGARWEVWELYEGSDVLTPLRQSSTLGPLRLPRLGWISCGLSDAQKLSHVHWTSGFRLANARQEETLRLAALNDMILDPDYSAPHCLVSPRPRKTNAQSGNELPLACWPPD